MKQQATPSEREHMGRVAGLGCLICGQQAEVHHIREGQGMSQRASHFLTVPLCPDHHRGELSIHGSPRQFKNLYGDELGLLAQTIERLSR